MSTVGDFPENLLTSTRTRAATDRTGRIGASLMARSKAEQWVLERVRAAQPELLGEHKQDARPDRAKLDPVVEEIDAGHAGNELRWRRNFLIRFLAAGTREFGWPALQYTPVIRLKERGAPINASNFAYLSRIGRLRAAFLADWQAHGSRAARLKEGDDPALAQAQVLWSAILFGGLLSASRLVRVAQHGLERLDATPSLLWIDWADDPTSELPMWSRWIPDRLTALLLAQARQAGLKRLSNLAHDGRDARRQIYPNLLRPFAQTLALAPDDIPTSLTALLVWASTWHFMYLPPFLVEYARERLPSASLAPGAWRRIMLGRAEPAEPAGEGTVGAGARASTALTVERHSRAEAVDLSAQSRALRTILRGRGAEHGKRTREKHVMRTRLLAFREQANLAPLIALLAAWAYERLSPDAPRKTTPSVVQADCETIDTALIAHIGFRDPVTFTEEIFEELYCRVLEKACSSKTYNRRSAALANFHGFLVDQFGVAGRAEDYFDAIPETGGVDANLFSEQSFRAVRHTLSAERNPGDPIRADMRVLAFTLAARCGLRRGELRRLRYADIVGRHAPTLVLRHRPGERLKSDSSERVLPLAVLLESVELDHLRMHLASLEGLLSTSANPAEADALYLFHDVGEPQRPLPEATLVDPITAALRAETGSAWLREHHCRHTALNQLFLKMMEASLPGCSALLCDRASAEDGLRLSEGLVGTREPHRHALWATTMMAGHLSPEVTVGNYLHLNCWLLYCAVERLQTVAPEPTRLARHLGLSRENVRVRRSRYRLPGNAWFALVLCDDPVFRARWRIEPPAVPAPPEKPLMPPDAVADAISSAARPVSVMHVLNILNELADRFEPRPHANARRRSVGKPEALPPLIRQVAQIYRLDDAQLARWWHLVKAFERLEGLSRSRAHTRKALTASVPTLASGELRLERPMSLPRPIKRREEHIVADRLFQGLVACIDTERTALETFLSAFWRARSVDEKVLRTSDPDVGRVLVTTLAPLIEGVTQAPDQAAAATAFRLEIAHDPAPSAGGLTPEAQRAAWAAALGVPVERFSDGVPAKKTLKGKERGSIRVTLAYEAPMTEAGKRKRQSKGTVAARHKSTSGILEAIAYVLTLCILDA